MLLIAEIGLTIIGLLLLIRGRPIGKDSVAHPHFRFLGGFLLTLLPVVFVAAIAFGLIWAVTHPDTTPESFAQDSRWPLIGLEVGVVVLYSIIGNFWEKAIKRKAAALAAQNTAA